MAVDLTKITAAVSKAKTVDESAVLLLAQLSALLRANADDPAAINALADQLDAQSTSLADAITANTPAP
jgi:hypothetical protein